METGTAQAIPRVIVVAEQEIHDLLRGSGVQWDVQHRIESVGHMWDDLSGGRLDQHSVAVLFSDSVYASPGELEAAVATMAPSAPTFVVAWDPTGTAELLGRVRDAAHQLNLDPEAPVHLLPTDSGRALLDEIAAVVAARGLPVHVPEQYDGELDGPLTRSADEVPVFAPLVAAADEPVAAAAVDLDEPVTLDAPVAHDPVDLEQPVAAEPVDLDQPVTVEPVSSVAPGVTQAPVAVAPVSLGPVTPVAPAPQPAAGPAPAPASTAPRPAAEPTAPRSDSAEPIDRTPGALPGKATFAVTSSKGGSGKSTTAMMLAAQIATSSRLAYEQGLADRPLKVVLVDMDTRDGQVASLVGQYIPTALNIRLSPQWDEETILANLVSDSRLGIDALLAPVRPRTADDVGPEFYGHVIRTLKTTHDVVIMDTSVNYLDPLISTVCLTEATAILFVTTLATTSVQGMARALREITESTENGGMGIDRRKLGIVVNQSVTDVGMEQDQVLQAALRVPVVGAVPLATRDVLTATNFNRMHKLLEHPRLGPAYHRLATACLADVNLVPLVEAEQGSSDPTPLSAADAEGSFDIRREPASAGAPVNGTSHHAAAPSNGTSPVPAGVSAVAPVAVAPVPANGVPAYAGPASGRGSAGDNESGGRRKRRGLFGRRG